MRTTILALGPALMLLGSLALAQPSAQQTGDRAVVDAAAFVPPFEITSRPPFTFGTHSEFVSWGYAWGLPDGTFGAIPRGNGTYAFYGTGGASGSCSGSPDLRGVFQFSGTLDRVTGSVCQRLFGPGDGNGWTFDKDYAGGGQIIPFSASGTTGYLMSFHAEIHWQDLQNPPTFDCANVPCFYSSLGLAVSTDGGKTFRVAGQVYQPSQPMSVFTGGGKNMAVGYGSLIVADANGHHIDNPPSDPTTAYIYLFSSDFSPSAPGVCANYNCLGVARALYSDVVAAVLSGDPHRVATVFHKYDGSSPNAWTQPATGNTADTSGTAGTYAPLWTDEPAYDPTVLYDRAFNVYLVVYPTLAGAKIRASSDLIHWSGPIGAPIAETGRTVQYPMLMGETGDPNVGGTAPRLYYTSFAPFPDWSTSVFECVQLNLVPPAKRRAVKK